MRKIHGNADVPIVVFSLLSLGFAGLCAYFYYQGMETQKKLADIKSKNSSAAKDLENTRQALHKISNLVGFHRSTSSSGDLRSDPQAIIAKLEFACNKESGLDVNLAVQKIEEEKLFDPKYIQGIIKLEHIWEKYAKKIEELQKQLEELQTRYKDEISLYAQETQNTVTKTNQLESEVQEKRKKLEETRKENEETLRKEEDERAQIRAANIQDKEKLAELYRTRRIQKQKDESEMENLEERINELKVEAEGQSGVQRWFQDQPTVQKVQESADGEIIFVDQKSQTAYIDLGLSTGILKGIPFQVFRYGKGGVKEYKGKVVVKSVEDNISMVGIMETTNSLEPILVGDKIINPVYDKDKVRYFVIAGRLGKYSSEQASRLVEKLGGKIEKEISAKTDFVVLGDGFKKDPTYQVATERGIETMLESEFLGYLGD